MAIRLKSAHTGVLGERRLFICLSFCLQSSLTVNRGRFVGTPEGAVSPVLGLNLKVSSSHMTTILLSFEHALTFTERQPMSGRMPVSSCLAFFINEPPLTHRPLGTQRCTPCKLWSHILPPAPLSAPGAGLWSLQGGEGLDERLHLAGSPLYSRLLKQCLVPGGGSTNS